MSTTSNFKDKGPVCEQIAICSSADPLNLNCFLLIHICLQPDCVAIVFIRVLTGIVTQFLTYTMVEMSARYLFRVRFMHVISAFTQVLLYLFIFLIISLIKMARNGCLCIIPVRGTWGCVLFTSMHLHVAHALAHAGSPTKANPACKQKHYRIIRKIPWLLSLFLRLPGCLQPWHWMCRLQGSFTNKSATDVLSKKKHVTGNHGIEYAGLMGPWLFGVCCELFWEKSLKRSALQCHR